MRAVLLLCLLHAAAAVRSFNWDGPGRATPETVADPASACSVDKLSCECCRMIRETTRLQTYFNSALTSLEKEFDQVNQTFVTLQDSRVAFSVSLYTGDNFRCYGPLSVDAVVAYQHSFINLGMAYSPSTGVFTVNLPGVYSLAVTSFSDAGSPGNTLAVCTSLQVNGQIVAGSRELNRKDQEDSTTVAVALKLKAGDKVSVKLNRGCFLCDDSSHYNTFSGFLLYADA